MKTIWDILPSVARGTEQKKISWESDGIPGRSFTAALDGKYGLRVWHWTDPDSDIEGLTVALTDEAGFLIDEAKADQFDPKHAELEKFFYTARRSALNVEAAIGDVEKVLAKLQLR